MVNRDCGINFRFGFLFGYWVGDWCTNFRFKFSFWWCFWDWGIRLRYWFQVLGLCGCYFIQLSEPRQIPHLYSGMSFHLCCLIDCNLLVYAVCNMELNYAYQVYVIVPGRNFVRSFTGSSPLCKIWKTQKGHQMKSFYQLLFRVWLWGFLCGIGLATENNNTVKKGRNRWKIKPISSMIDSVPWVQTFGPTKNFGLVEMVRGGPHQQMHQLLCMVMCRPSIFYSSWWLLQMKRVLEWPKGAWFWIPSRRKAL